MSFIFRHSILRPSLISVAILNFFNFVFAALFILYATRELDVRSGTLGIVLGAGAVGGLLGAAVAGRLGRRIGIGPSFVLGMVLFPAPLLLVPLAGGPEGPRAGDALHGGVSLCGRRHDPRHQRWRDHHRFTPHRLRSRATGALRFVNTACAPRERSRAARSARPSVCGRPSRFAAGAAGLVGVLWLLAFAGAAPARAARGGAGVEGPPLACGARLGCARGRDRHLRRRSPGPSGGDRGNEGSGLRSTVVTFDPHPRLVLGYDVQLLTTLERRIELIGEIGPDDLFVLEFTTGALPARAGGVRRRGPRADRNGDGRRGRGDFASVRAQGGRRAPAAAGHRGAEVPQVEGVSSSRIRELLRKVTCAGLRPLLGRPPELEGGVVSGDQRGGTLGFPDGESRSRAARPRPGLRDLRGRGARSGAAAISIGVNPHYGGSERRIEAFLLDFEGDSTAGSCASSSGTGFATSARSRARTTSYARSRLEWRRHAKRRGRVTQVFGGFRRLSKYVTWLHLVSSVRCLGLRNGLSEAGRGRDGRVEPGLSALWLRRLGARRAGRGRRDHGRARAAPLRRGSAAPPLLASKLTPPK